jgi:hypothetical protein
MMVMTSFCRCATHPIAMCPVAKLDTIQHAFRDQVVHRTKDGGAADPQILLLKVVPQLVGGKVALLIGQACEPVRDETARARVARSHAFERCANGLCCYHCLVIPFLRSATLLITDPQF